MSIVTTSSIVKFEGNFYDLGGFDHPGGNELVCALHDTDVTTLVYIYHPHLNMQDILCRLHVYKVSMTTQHLNRISSLR